MRVLSRFDAFSKAEDHVQLRTLGGGIVSILAMGVMVYLVISEFMYYGHIERDSHVLVYNARDSSDITVSVDIELNAIKCDEAKIQIQNKRGDHSDLDLKKVPAGESGCRLSGSFPIPRIAGIFQISSKPLAQNSNFFFSMLGLAENVSGGGGGITRQIFFFSFSAPFFKVPPLSLSFLCLLSSYFAAC